jgi:hypothetical protein
MSSHDIPDMPSEEPKTISCKIRLDVLTNTVIKEANILVVALPLNTPQFVALGFLWSVLSEMTQFYAACAAAAQSKKGGIVKASVADAVNFGKSLLK